MIHGARGSYPVAGEQVRRYGGATSCFSLETADGLLIVDAGTGIASLGDALAQRATLPPITILLTHFHLDHLIGIPAFKPLARRDARVTFMADTACAGDWPRLLTTLIGKPWWPVELKAFGASIQFEPLPDGALARYGLAISRCPVWHPQGCVSYRIETPTRTIVLATDREHGDAAQDQAFAAFCRGADVLIHDAQYTSDEHAGRRGWGHSTGEQGARVAADVGVKQLVLVSHDPSRSDDDVDRIVEQAQRTFPNAVGGSAGMGLA